MSETASRVVQTGDRVKLSYVGCFEDGTQFDSSEGNAPLVFTVGAGEVIPGFDKGVIGMKCGEQRSFKVAPVEGYGPHVSEMVVEIERNMIPDDDRLAVGSFLEATMEDGRSLEVQVVKLTETTVFLDGNHPLAGKTLHFEINLLGFV